MMRRAVFPGSFDPITIGHESVIRRALPLFDELIVAIGVNADKKGFFPVEKRLEWIKYLFDDEPKVKVAGYDGLTVEFCKKENARFILRGLRTAADFEFERSIAQVNRKLTEEVETVFILTLPEHTAINSSIVRDILRHGGDVSAFVPGKLKEKIKI